MEDFRLGLIGCGGMMRAHVGALNLVPGVKVTAICDIIEERALNVAEVCDEAYVTTDYKTMCDYVDGVLVVLPHDLHFECGTMLYGSSAVIEAKNDFLKTLDECKEICTEDCKHNVIRRLLGSFMRLIAPLL